MNIKHYSLESFPLCVDNNFAVIGNGESALKYKYNQYSICVIAINKAIRFLYDQKTINCFTMYWHTDQIVDYIYKLSRHESIFDKKRYNLVTIGLRDIAKNRLPSGDTINMAVHYIIYKMTSKGIRDKKIYLSGVDYSYQKDWKPQIESLNYCSIVGEYNNNQIIKTSENKRLDFLTTGNPDIQFLSE